MKSKNQVYLFVIAALLIVSCSKGGGNEPAPKPPVQSVSLRSVTAKIGDTPISSLTGVTVKPSFNLSFSDVMRTSEILVVFELKELPAGVVTPLNAVQSQDLKYYTITLTNPLKINTEYQLSITQNLVISSSTNSSQTNSFSFKTTTGVPIINVSAINSKINYFKLIGGNFSSPVIKAISPSEFESSKPAESASWDIGYINNSGEILITEPTTNSQLEVFTSGQQGAIFYLSQLFLSSFYNTTNIPYWFKSGFAAYESRARPSVAKIREVVTKLGRTPSMKEYYNSQFFKDNYGIGITGTFFEWLGLYIGMNEMRWNLRVNQDGSLFFNIYNTMKSIEDADKCWKLFLNGCYLNGTNKLIRFQKETAFVEYYYSDFDASLFPEYSNILDDYLNTYTNLLSTDIAGKISFLLMPERCYHFEWGGGICDPNSWSIGGGLGACGFRMVSPNATTMGDGKHLMKHEFAHALQFQIKPNFMPAWLSEGFAEFLSNDGLLSATKISSLKASVNEQMNKAITFYGQKPTYDQMCTYVDILTQYNYYILGHVMVDFVVRNYGYSGLKKVVQGDGFNVSVLGLSGKEEFMTKFYQYYDSTWK